MKDKKRLGEMLLEARLMDELQLQSALAQQKQWGNRLGSIVIEMGFVSEKDLASVLEKQMGVRCISIEDVEVPYEALRAVKVDVAKKYGIFPLSIEGKTITVAMADPTDLKIMDSLSFLLGMRIKPVLAIYSDIKRAIERHYEGISTGKAHKIDIKKISEKIHVVHETAEAKPTAPAEFEVIHDMPHVAEEVKQAAPQKEESTSKRVIEALISLLAEKGIITKEELIRKMKGGQGGAQTK